MVLPLSDRGVGMNLLTKVPHQVLTIGGKRVKHRAVAWCIALVGPRLKGATSLSGSRAWVARASGPGVAGGVALSGRAPRCGSALSWLPTGMSATRFVGMNDAASRGGAGCGGVEPTNGEASRPCTQGSG